MEIKIKKLREEAVLPAKGTEGAAGFDLCACVDYPIVFGPGHTTLIQTGLAVSIPKGYFGAVFARSGMAVKRGLRPANCVGVIDSDYRGEIMVALHNDSDRGQTVGNGERVAQLLILPCQTAEFVVTEDLDETDRGAGGFGSTGTAAIKEKEPGYEQPSLFTE